MGVPPGGFPIPKDNPFCISPNASAVFNILPIFQLFFFFIIIFIELRFLNMALKRRNKKATKTVPGQKEASKSCLPQL